MSELLGALGLAWPRLLIYPGGLAALLGAWLLDRWWRIHGHAAASDAAAFNLVDLLPPLLALTLVPLPPARPFPYGLDLPTALFLAEWPRWRVLARTGALAPDRIAGLLPPYGVLLLAIGALATATGSLELAALTRRPAALADQLLLWCGALLWLAALPALAGTVPSAALPLQLRALTLLVLPALVLLGALVLLLEPWFSAAALAWLAPPLALSGAVVLLTGLSRLSQLRLRRIRWVLAGVIGGVVLVQAVGAAVGYAR